jgi:hypothetical protein
MENKKKPSLSESIATIESQITYYKSINSSKTVKILEKILNRLLAEKKKTKTSS